MAVTHYTWDELDDNVLMETDENGAVAAQYTQEPGRYGPVLSQNRGGAESFYHFDGQGSTRQLTDGMENITNEAAYSAFGNEVTVLGSNDNPFGYKGALGYYADPERKDELYLRARTLNTCLGRFLSFDPLDSTSLYIYSQNNPLVMSDPTGLVCVDKKKCCCCPKGIDFKLIRDLGPNEEVINCFIDLKKTGPTSYGNEFLLIARFFNLVRDDLEENKPCGLRWYERSSDGLTGPDGKILYRGCQGWVDTIQRAKELGVAELPFHTTFKEGQERAFCPSEVGNSFMRDCPVLPRASFPRLLCIHVKVLSACSECQDKEIRIKQTCRLVGNRPVCTVVPQPCSQAEWDRFCPGRSPQPPLEDPQGPLVDPTDLRKE